MIGNKKKILLIEDERGFRQIYRDLFTSQDYEVIEAEDGESGVNKAEAEKPDLILLDIVLPKLSGIDTLKRLRSMESLKKTPVLLFSVIDKSEVIDEGLREGAQGYIVKGSNTEEVLKKVKEIIPYEGATIV